MSFVVTKSSPAVLVGPSEPTPAGNIRLSSVDKSHLCVPFTSFHVFDRAISKPAETIRRALSHALVHYYPFAGRLVFGGGGDVQIACTGDGVTFVAATASCSLEDAGFLHAPLAIPLADLAVRYGGRCGVSDPLLTMQVTGFGCGGYVVGVTWNHAVGMAQLLTAVGELARGLPGPSVVPARSHDGSVPEIPQLLTAIMPCLVSCKHVDFAYTDVTIPWSFIDRVKAAYAGAGNGDKKATTFEVVTAAMWQCRTLMLLPNSQSMNLLRLIQQESSLRFVKKGLAHKKKQSLLAPSYC